MLPLVALPALLLAFQQPTATASSAGLPPSPVKRIEVQPAGRTITAGDSVRLTLRALDESGRPVSNAVLAVKMLGGQGEGAMRDTTMWLVASSVGKFPLALIALVPGTEPFVDSTSVEFLGVPGPAERVDLAPKAATIVPGSRSGSARSPSPRPTTGRWIQCAGGAVRPRSRRWTGTASSPGTPPAPRG